MLDKCAGGWCFQGVFDVAGLVRDENCPNDVVSCLARTTRTVSSDILDFYPLFGMKSYGTFYIREREYDVTLYTRMIHNLKGNLGDRLHKLSRTTKSMRTSVESLIQLYSKMGGFHCYLDFLLSPNSNL